MIILDHIVHRVTRTGWRPLVEAKGGKYSHHLIKTLPSLSIIISKTAPL